MHRRAFASGVWVLTASLAWLGSAEARAAPAAPPNPSESPGEPPPVADTAPAPAEAPAPVETPAAEAPAVASPPADAELPPRPVRAAPIEPVSPQDGVRLELEIQPAAELELYRIDPRAGDRAVGTVRGEPFVLVCAAPCPEPVEAYPGDEFFFASPDVVPSPMFSLDDEGEVARMRVRPGSRRMRMAGFGMLVVGAILVPAGILIAAAVPGEKAVDAAGYSTLGVGGLSLAIGIGLTVGSRTKIEFAPR